jgi:hypothetical protein
MTSNQIATTAAVVTVMADASLSWSGTSAMLGVCRADGSLDIVETTYPRLFLGDFARTDLKGGCRVHAERPVSAAADALANWGNGQQLARLRRGHQRRECRSVVVRSRGHRARTRSECFPDEGAYGNKWAHKPKPRTAKTALISLAFLPEVWTPLFPSVHRRPQSPRAVHKR